MYSIPVPLGVVLYLQKNSLCSPCSTFHFCKRDIFTFFYCYKFFFFNWVRIEWASCLVKIIVWFRRFEMISSNRWQHIYGPNVCKRKAQILPKRTIAIRYCIMFFSFMFPLDVAVHSLQFLLSFDKTQTLINDIFLSQAWWCNERRYASIGLAEAHTST